jgi:inorganic phosphate transporter, PiT family
VTTLEFAIVVIAVALVFDFVNGWHDSANSIATVVATRVLSPRAAVLWAASFNFIAFLIFGTFVAKTIGSDLIRISAIEKEWQVLTLLCALIGATLWDIITWHYGLPSSSSHALIGGYAGSAIAAHHGVQGLLIAEGWIKTVGFIVIAPILGLLLGSAAMVAVSWICRRRTPARVDRTFRKLQLLSAALYSLGHGGNDAQKTMGIIAGVLVASNIDGQAATHIPLWVVLACHAAMGLGTLSGGWRIVRTMGNRITRLRPVGGFAAESAGAATLFLATYSGIPVSTTHTIAGAIAGVGCLRRFSAVRWRIAANLVWAWLLTMPVSAFISAVIFLCAAAIKSSGLW